LYLQTTGGKDEQSRHELSYKQLEVKTNKHYMSPATNTGGKNEQTIHEPSYKQLEVKTNKQYVSPPTNNLR
jgi:hypothetical protein